MPLSELVAELTDCSHSDVQTCRATVDNAGLVLTWPFISRLFDINGLLHEGNFKSAADQKIAWHLLNYVSYRQSDNAATSLLTDILCGCASSPPAIDTELSADKMASADNMLAAIIKNWHHLGKTTAEGLRSTFIARLGYLSADDSAWHLVVEEGPFDMLLDALPWSYSSLQLPWMEKPLNVTWR